MRTRWPILALLCVLASLLVPGTASAHSATGAENRVWAFELAEPVHVAGAASLTLELHPGYELAEYDSASGSLLAARGGGRGGNKLKPDPNATGPHSTWKTDGNGNVTGHAEWKPNSWNPSGFDEAKRVDLKGDSHFNKVTGQDVPTPHAHGKGIPGGVRPANPGEIPGGGN